MEIPVETVDNLLTRSDVGRRRANIEHSPELCACPLCTQDWDAAKRASDTINNVRAHNDWDAVKNGWMAFRLLDGGSDGVVYDTKQEAIRHQQNEQMCMYIAFRNLMGGATPKEVVRFLRFTREAYDSGMRLVDPDDVNGGPDLAPTSARMDLYRPTGIAVPRFALDGFL